VTTAREVRQTVFRRIARRSHAEGTDNDLGELVAAVTTIAQSQCERATDYADVEMLVSRLPIEHLTFAAHDSSASYSGPYPMAILVRAFIIEEINGWDETALHDHLRANPSFVYYVERIPVTNRQSVH
jgi:putative transposase